MFPSISGDGSVIAFDSTADDLGPTVPSGHIDEVYISVGGGAPILISKSATGKPADGDSFGDGSWNAYVSANGQFVAFESFADNLGLGAKGA